MTKDEIIHTIRITAEANGGTPLGKIRLFKETGIAEHHYMKFGTLGQLQREAGFSANEMNQAASEDDLINQFIKMCCRFDRFPTNQQFRQARHDMPNEFASHNTFNRLGRTQASMAATVVAALSVKETLDTEQQAALDICLPIAEQSEAEANDPDAKMVTCGYVYLFRDGKGYKIGKSSDPDSRRAALQTGNPRRIKLVHRILTDDPSGMENYWKKRFSDCRIGISKGHEWFRLSREDVKAFRARIRM